MSTFCAKIGEFSYFLWNSSKSPPFWINPTIPHPQKSVPPFWPKIPQNGKIPPFWPHWFYFIYLFVLISWSIYQNTERKTTHCHWAVTGFLSATIYFFAQLSWVSQFFCWFWRSKNISKKFQSNNLKKNLFEKIFRFAQIFKSFLLKFAKILCLWLMIRK